MDAGIGRVAGALLSFQKHSGRNALGLWFKEISFLFNERRCDMEDDLPEPFADFGRILSEIRIFNPDLFLNTEKLVEVIQLEIEFRMNSQIPTGSNQSYSWTDGANSVFISVHAEEETPINHWTIALHPEQFLI
jgi:hypothetical protein